MKRGRSTGNPISVQKQGLRGSVVYRFGWDCLLPVPRLAHRDHARKWICAPALRPCPE